MRRDRYQERLDRLMAEALRPVPPPPALSDTEIEDALRKMMSLLHAMMWQADREAYGRAVARRAL